MVVVLLGKYINYLNIINAWFNIKLYYSRREYSEEMVEFEPVSADE